jgi:multiple sugar transport system permease protein
MTVTKAPPTRTYTAYLLLIALSIIVVFPFLWMISSSLKLLQEVFAYPIQWIPKVLHWENYKTVIDVGFLKYLMNSLKVTGAIVLIQGLTSILAGYSFAKIRFPGRDIIFLAYIATMMIPGQVLMIPQFILMGKLQLSNSLYSLIILGSFSAYSVFMMRQYFITIPQEMIESARIDGCGEFQTLSRIILPLSKPMLATMLIFIIMAYWNDMLTPLVYLHRKSLFTLPLGILEVNSIYGTQMNLVMAGAFLSIIPILIAYVFGQKYFINGIMAGAVKG